MAQHITSPGRCSCGEHTAPAVPAPPADGTPRYIPLVPGSKRPVLRRCQYGDGWPAGDWLWEAVAAGYRVGLLPGPSGLVVVDADVGLAWTVSATGASALPRLVTGLESLAAAGVRLPACPWERTPSGGWHLFYAQNPGWPVLHSRLRWDGHPVDVKVTGLVAVWPSDGYVRGDDGGAAPPVLPGELARLFFPAAAVPGPSGPWTAARVEGILARLREAEAGQRNATLNWAAWKLREAVSEGVVTREEAEGLLTAAAPAGLGEAEVRSTVRSGLGDA